MLPCRYVVFEWCLGATDSGRKGGVLACRNESQWTGGAAFPELLVSPHAHELTMPSRSFNLTAVVTAYVDFDNRGVQRGSSAKSNIVAVAVGEITIGAVADGIVPSFVGDGVLWRDVVALSCRCDASSRCELP